LRIAKQKRRLKFLTENKPDKDLDLVQVFSIFSACYVANYFTEQDLSLQQK